MSDKQLRAGLIRLAHSKPELRAQILPLLAQGKGKQADQTKQADLFSRHKASLTLMDADSFAPRITVHLYDGGGLGGQLISNVTNLLEAKAKAHTALLNSVRNAVNSGSRKLPFSVKLDIRDPDPSLYVDQSSPVIGVMSRWDIKWLLAEKDTELLIAKQAETLADLFGLDFKKLG